LLAGIFGSAFVPSALAAGRPADADPAPKASLTTVTEDASSQIMEGATNKFGFLSDDSDQITADVDVSIVFGINSAGGANLTSADLKAVSSNSGVLVAWGYDDDGVEDTCDDIDGDGADDDGTDNAGDDAFKTTDIVLEAPDLGAAAGDYMLCLAGATTTSAATSTVTIYAAAAGTEEWVLLKTLTVTAIGSIASLELSITDGYKYVAEDNDAVNEWLTVIGKDSNGTIINGDEETISSGFDLVGTITEWEDNPLHNDEDTAIAFFSGASDVNNADGGSTLYDLEANTCLNDADDDYDDAGSSFSLKIANAAQTVVSNAITITCTRDSDGAIVTAVRGEASTGSQVYDDGATGDNEYSFYATVTDEDGRPLGDGAASQDYVWSLDFSVTNGVSAEFVDNGTEVALGGEVELGYFDNSDGAGNDENPDFGRLGRHSMTITAADSDIAAADNVEAEFTVTYVATGADDTSISSTRNAAKTRATITADMGEGNAFERIEFYVELANGNVKTYTRRANANGVATLVQVRRTTTVYVYADVEAGGSPTDVLKVVFK
jgi:hypothetical protein